MAFGSTRTETLSAPCPCGAGLVSSGGLKEATMVSSRNDVKVGLEIRKHSDKPTDMRFIEGLERSYLMN